MSFIDFLQENLKLFERKDIHGFFPQADINNFIDTTGTAFLFYFHF